MLGGIQCPDHSELPVLCKKQSEKSLFPYAWGELLDLVYMQKGTYFEFLVCLLYR